MCAHAHKIVDRVARESLSKKVSFQYRPEGTGGRPRRYLGEMNSGREKNESESSEARMCLESLRNDMWLEWKKGESIRR